MIDFPLVRTSSTAFGLYSSVNVLRRRFPMKTRCRVDDLKDQRLGRRILEHDAVDVRFQVGQRRRGRDERRQGTCET